MSAITVYNDDAPDSPLRHTTSLPQIAAILRDHGVRFERWNALHPVEKGATSDDVLAAYKHEVNGLMAAGGYQTADVVSLTPDSPNKTALRAKFLDEHTHSEDEIRFFVAGSGMFYLHLGDTVLQILCEKGDLLAIPADTKHWFDTGPEPSFTAIRIFTDPAGWVAEYTGTDIASRFPKYE